MLHVTRRSLFRDMLTLEELQQKILQIQEGISLRTVRSPTTVSRPTNSVGGLPEGKHLDGKNYGDWKLLMQNFPIDAGLWCCISPREGQAVDPDLAKINLSLKPCAAKVTRKCETAKLVGTHYEVNMKAAYCSRSPNWSVSLRGA